MTWFVRQEMLAFKNTLQLTVQNISPKCMHFNIQCFYAVTHYN